MNPNNRRLTDQVIKLQKKFKKSRKNKNASSTFMIADEEIWVPRCKHAL